MAAHGNEPPINICHYLAHTLSSDDWVDQCRRMHVWDMLEAKASAEAVKRWWERALLVQYVECPDIVDRKSVV